METARKYAIMVRWKFGPAWVERRSVRDQPFWMEHAAFMDEIFDDGKVVLGGPFADGTGSMVIFQGLAQEEVASLIAKDPFVTQGVFVLGELKQWELFLDARRTA